ncbi:Inositol-1, 4, 5-trisphosphate 5-Phosphatase-like protein [Zostera marina]|uniref:Inositol-1, 4, 5-trisphosphate 5-Phosphatase-like protein n=1 Tax=Zostera marina TaxID=29655 RepID=A0A0K9P0R7_ZOSMR|nr:Inositol-1, 4, 5-trisphosphate 5-Phosphatase-like protein [Zostera marina]
MVHVFLFFSTKIWIDGFHVKYLFSISSRSFVELRSMFDKQISTVSILSVHDFNMMLRSVNFAACALPPDSQKYRVFAATWNVGGKPPDIGMNLEETLLPAGDRSDIYVLGFQEIVPLNAGNVLVIEDNEPAAKWLSLINRALNKPPEFMSSSDVSASSTTTKNSSVSFFQKSSLKSISRSFRTEQGKRVKTCNCHYESLKKNRRESCFRCPKGYLLNDMVVSAKAATVTQQLYGIVACKQMVGIFVTVWARKELVQYIGHLRVASVGHGIFGCFRNKGSICVSMSLHQTSFCFICSHLASGEKEGNGKRRNADVIEILKNTQFPKICKKPFRRNPEKILEHDRVIWLGDLNYRISLSYNETRNFLQDNNWSSLLEKDQLKMERKQGKVFEGWNEGNIYFAPTYKYSSNSDAYMGETMAATTKNRRTPAWCDRILWHGNGIEQLSYIRVESKFSDHRPVTATFLVEVGITDVTLKNQLGDPGMKVAIEELLPKTRTQC